MREFATTDRLDRRLAAKRLPKAALAEFGAELARFHVGCRPCAASRPATRTRARRRCATSTSSPAISGRAGSASSTLLRAWTERQCASLAPLFARRAAAGAHRECHGDLHLQNLLWRDGKIVAFDALEFDRKLRDIDVVSEAAFLAMDLRAHGRTDLAYEFLNRYLEVGGDYDGVDVLPFYLVYRALVRAKVAAIKRAQSAADGHDAERYSGHGARALRAEEAAARHHARPFRQRQDVRDRRARRPPARDPRCGRISSASACTGSPLRRAPAPRSGPACTPPPRAGAPTPRWPRSRTGCCATVRAPSSMRRSCGAASGSSSCKSRPPTPRAS